MGDDETTGRSLTPDSPERAVMFWLAAGMTSARRVLDPSTPAVWSGEPRASSDDLQGRTDAALMVLALRNLLRAAEWLAKALPPDRAAEGREALAAFEQYLPDVVHARDALEHFDEYAVGTGRRQRAAGDPSPYTFDLVLCEGRLLATIGPHDIDVAAAREGMRWLTLRMLALVEVPGSDGAEVCDEHRVPPRPGEREVLQPGSNVE